MGGTDKGLLMLNGKAMIEHIIDALAPQCETIVVNANRNLDEYRAWNYPVIADLDNNFNGPLAGMAACMSAIDSEFMLTLPCDSPLVANDYAERMLLTQHETAADICVARDEQRISAAVSCCVRSIRSA